MSEPYQYHERGFPLPQICHYPPAPFTSGPEFTELAASAGLVLDPWQDWVLDIGLGERPDGKWASFQNVVEVARQNGKDGIFEALGLGWLFLTGEKLIGHSAHEYKTAMEAFRRLVGLIENSDDLRKRVKKIINTNGEEGIELLPPGTIISGAGPRRGSQTGGQRMRFLARSKGAGRGFSFDKMIWNEAYALVAAQVDAVLPALSARPNPQLWLGSSPPLDETTGEALFRARKAARAGAAGMMMVAWGLECSLDDIGPCAPGCRHQPGASGCILDDREMWAATNPAYPHRISAEAIERERVTMDPVGFARERGGAWPPDLSEGFAVITRAQWERLIDPPTALVGRPAVAVAVTPRSAGPVQTSIAIAQRRADGKAHVELVLFGPGSSWAVAALAAFKAANNPCATVIDPGSPAGSLIPDVQAAGVEVTTMSSRDVASAFGMIYDAATSADPEGRTVTHLGQAETLLAVQQATTRTIGDSQAWDSRTTTANTTPIIAITNALWGLAAKGAAPDVVPWVMYA